MNKLLKGGLVMFVLFADSSIKSSVAALEAFVEKTLAD